jgi:hypothetical protein
MAAGIDVTTSGDDAASDDLGAGRCRRRMSAARPPEGPHQGKEARMRSNDAEAPRGIITELREALDAIPADEPRNYLRQSLQLLVPLLEQMHQRLQALDARLEALESGDCRGEVFASYTRRPEGGPHSP